MAVVNPDRWPRVGEGECMRNVTGAITSRNGEAVQGGGEEVKNVFIKTRGRNERETSLRVQSKKRTPAPAEKRV